MFPRPSTYLIALLLMVLSGAAHAVPFSVTQSQNITVTGQGLVFNFLGLPGSDGNGGTLDIFAKGDFNANISETVTVTLDLGVLGSLVMNDSGVTSNTIAGLSLDSFVVTNIVNLFDVEIDASFSLSGGLLDSMLADGNITTSTQNTGNVQSHAAGGQDFISITYAYNTPVPEPTTAALLGLGLVGFGFRRRRAG